MGFSPYAPAGFAARAAGAALVWATVVGCSGDPPARSPTPTTPVDVCASLVSYWVKEGLKGSKWAGLDWEQKGLSNEQLAIHDDVLARARDEERRAGRQAAEQLADRLATRRCAAAEGATGSSENWRPPLSATPSHSPPS
ncbi:hypothetical protein [Streptomyces purpureus]|uniref:Uncharacterized protein n=1 Tax=Streptomyces purpureus TaxID=1951 RepID=A0A918LMV5_9ACTN|nr:hypothetical protein [Streptomyces purpureus]GGT23793.1 hypothetical protein GCM10014713_15960 [Streptomyces purpureus]